MQDAVCKEVVNANGHTEVFPQELGSSSKIRCVEKLEKSGTKLKATRRQVCRAERNGNQRKLVGYRCGSW